MEITTRITNVKDALIDLLKSVKMKYIATKEDDAGNPYELYKLYIDDDETEVQYYIDKRLLKIGFECFAYKMKMTYHMLKLINAYIISRGYKLFGYDVDKIIWKFCEDYDDYWEENELTFERDTEFEEVHKDMKNNKVKFIDYTGRYPNLCSGELRVEINGEELILSNVLRSGGTWGFDKNWNDYVTHGAWEVDLGRYPELKEFENEITEVVNKNVPQGCCGGCI